MEITLAKIAAFICFIALGAVLRRCGILKGEAFHAISGLVLYVTLPCIIITNLNGVKIEGTMLLIAGLGLATNLLFLLYAFVLTSREKDETYKDFSLLNFGGFSIGPMAVPFMQAFYPTTGLLTACMFDVGNVVMSAGGTYAIVVGRRQKGGLLAFFKTICGKLVRSGPLVAFALVVGMSSVGLKFPDAVTTVTQVGASANTFLCMIMIGESIDFSMSAKKYWAIVKLLLNRWVVCIVFALAAYWLLPFEGEVRTALMLVCFSPIPAMSLIYTAYINGDIAMAAGLSSLSVVFSLIAMSAVVLFLQM
ncbi:MAG: AEC family transporter [Sutterellaceae bacterium]|nr:AEC family transporter [Sutterellaceae bacterium]